MELKTQQILNIVKLNGDDFKYYFDSEHGQQDYTISQLKSLLINFALDCEIKPENIIKFCDELLVMSLEIACTNVKFKELETNE